ncbi:MAG: TonB-dependent receptor [Alphaproteobacteria bacterium]
MIMASVVALTPPAAAAADFAERMVVTATRQEAALLDQPGNVAVLSGEDVDFIRPDHIAEALNRLPGVYLHRNSGMDHLTAIRSPVLTGGAGAGSFLFLENGVPLRAAGFANVNGLFEAMTEFGGGLEVIRGPGSALYGNNAVHGLINVLLPDPVPDQETLVSASAGSFRRYHGRAQVSGTSGRHGYFAGVNLVADDGWREQTGLDQQKYLLQWIYSLPNIRVHTTFAAQNLNQESAGFIQGEEAFESSALSRTNPTPDGFRDGRAVRFASRIDWTRSERLTVSFTPYARWNDLDFRLTFVPSQALEESGHWSVGLLSAAYWRFDGGHRIIAGADVEYTEGSLREEQFLPTIFSFTQGLHYDYDVVSTVLAGYVQGTWAVAPRVTITGGLRVEYTEYDYTNNTDADIVGRFLRPADRVDDFLVATPKLGVVVDITPTVAGFVRYARGARAPQTTDLYRLTSNQTVGDVDVETLDSVELGFRGDIGRLSFDLAAYYAFKRNFFFRDADGFNVPDGKTQHIGVELEFLLTLTEKLSLALSGAHGRHTYRFDRPVTANSTESIAFGNDVDTAPRLFGTTRVIWNPVEAATVELAWTYLGDYFTDASNSNRYRGHQVLDLRGAWNLTPDVQIFAAVRNLANSDYANRADFAFGSARFFPAEDRAVSGGVTVRF